MIFSAKLYIVLLVTYSYYADGSHSHKLGVPKRTVPSDTLFHVVRLSVSSDAAPAYRDLACSYDADTSVALDGSDLAVLDTGYDAYVRCAGVIRLLELAPAVHDDVARSRSDRSVLLPDAE